MTIIGRGAIRGAAVVATALLVAALAVSALYLLGRSGSALPVGAVNTEHPGVVVETETGPEQEAGMRLAGLPGGQCQAWLSAFVLPPGGDLDARVAAAGGSGNWLEPGAWIGDAQSAARAFSATWAARSDAKPSELWIETSIDGRITQLKLTATTTPKGYQIWRQTASARVAPCSSNGE